MLGMPLGTAGAEGAEGRAGMPGMVGTPVPILGVELMTEMA